MFLKLWKSGRSFIFYPDIILSLIIIVPIKPIIYYPIDNYLIYLYFYFFRIGFDLEIY